MTMRNRLNALRTGFTSLKHSRSMEMKKLKHVQDSIEKNKLDLVKLEKTSDLLKNLTQTLIDRELKPIQEFTTFGLRKVFPDKDLEFTIDKKETATGTKYDFYLRDGKIKDTLDDSFGGSVEEVVSLMLRLIVIKRTNKVPVIFMDEFFTGVDARHRVNLIQLLRLLCEESGFHIFLISHWADFLMGAHTQLHAYPTEGGLKIKEVFDYEDGDSNLSEEKEASQAST